MLLGTSLPAAYLERLHNHPRMFMATIAMISESLANDATVYVEFLDQEGKTITDGTDSVFTFTVTQTPQSFANFMNITGGYFQTAKIPGIPDDAVEAKIHVAGTSAAAVRFNYGGTVDGTAGAGNGMRTATTAPTVNAPLRIGVGQTLSLWGAM